MKEKQQDLKEAAPSWFDFDARLSIQNNKRTLPAVADSGSSTPPTVLVGAASFSTRILEGRIGRKGGKRE